MAKTFKLELLAADRPFFVGECEHLIYPAQDGLVGVLPGHESLVTIVSPGEIQYKVDGEWRYAAISEGFAEIRSDYALILGDAIELPEEIDAKRAAEAATRAKERLRQRQSIMQYYQSQAALNRAMNRLKISRRHNHEISFQLEVRQANRLEIQFVRLFLYFFKIYLTVKNICVILAL